MNRSILSRILMPALAAAALGGATVATAATDVYLSVQLPVRTAAPDYVYDGAPSYREDWRRGDRRYDDRRYDRRTERRACRAAAWDANARYWPGQRVWRNGEVYVATGLSASVWNVNSPPEWTPNYWSPANCSPRDDRHVRQGRRGDWR